MISDRHTHYCLQSDARAYRVLYKKCHRRL